MDREKTITKDIFNNQLTTTAEISAATLIQPCMLCDNFREFSIYCNPAPYVCDDCKKAIAYAKELLKQNIYI